MAANIYPNIPKEKFAFVQAGERLTDKKLVDKPVGYFKDALRRFCRNRASIVAAGIIVAIFLFAFLTPLLTTGQDASLMDVNYAKKGPRNKFLSQFGIAEGTISTTDNPKNVVRNYAIGIGTAGWDGSVVSIRESKELDLQPVVAASEPVTVTDKWGETETTYSVTYDDYLTIGFMYMDIEQSEYQRIRDWEEETGIHVLYPMVAKNEYNPWGDNAYTETSAANYWYKMNSKFVPMVSNAKGNLKKIDLTENLDDLVLEDNYLRDEEGNPRYWIYSGGGTLETAQYKVRVLYYNYFQYKNGFEPQYLLGTDVQGYDLALRMAYGVRLSLLIAVIVSVINFLIGAVYGAIEGYYGGATDIIMERVSDILAGMPFIVLATLFQMHLKDKVGAVGSLLFAYVLTGWIGTASRVRTQFYRFKNQEYVMAARTLGAKDRRIIMKHIFPNSLGTLITSSALVIPNVIFTESMLSYLGIIKLGGADITSLGTLLSDASEKWTSYPHLMIFPALVISLLMISFNLFGNGLRDAFNPSLRGVED